MRGFLACFEPSADVLLIGALPFAAHKLAGQGNANDKLGTLYLGQRLLRRDAAGARILVELELPPASARRKLLLPLPSNRVTTIRQAATPTWCAGCCRGCATSRWSR